MKYFHQLIKQGAAVFMAAALVSGCAAQRQSSPEGADSGSKSAAAQNGTERHLNTALFWISTTLDPADDYNGWVLSRMGVGETLLRLNGQAEPEACIADAWEQIDDYTWEFHIRDGVMFSNGKAVDAQAVKLALERAYENNDRSGDYFRLKEMMAEGQKLTIVTDEPSGAILNNLCEPLFTVIDVEAPEEELDRSPVCTGPYQVTSFTPEASAECVKNDTYWGGQPGLDRISFTQVADSDSRVLALQSGETDLTGTIDNTNLSLFADESQYHTSVVLGPRTNVVYMNHEREFLSHKEIRQALSYAADRKQYTDLIGGEPATGLYSSALPFGQGIQDTYGYDPKAGNQVLDQAGYVDTDGDGYREVDGKAIVLDYYVSADHGSSDSSIISQALQADAAAVGIKIEIIQTENLADIRSAGSFDLCSANDSTAPTGDPQVFLEMRYRTGASANYQNYSNPLVDDKIDQMSRVFDIQKRQDLAREISQIILDDAASLYISYIPVNTVSSAKVRHAVQHPIDYYIITKDITIK